MRAYRQDGKLIVEIVEQNIIDGLHMLLGSEAVKVTDREKLLNYCADRICDFGDTGDFNSASNMTRLIDDLINEALEDDAGVEC